MIREIDYLCHGDFRFQKCLLSKALNFIGCSLMFFETYVTLTVSKASQSFPSSIIFSKFQDNSSNGLCHLIILLYGHSPKFVKINLLISLFMKSFQRHRFISLLPRMSARGYGDVEYSIQEPLEKNELPDSEATAKALAHAERHWAPSQKYFTEQEAASKTTHCETLKWQKEGTEGYGREEKKEEKDEEGGIGDYLSS
jgi:hypothetical protein